MEHLSLKIFRAKIEEMSRRHLNENIQKAIGSKVSYPSKSSAMNDLGIVKSVSTKSVIIKGDKGDIEFDLSDFELHPISRMNNGATWKISQQYHKTRNQLGYR